MAQSPVFYGNLFVRKRTAPRKVPTTKTGQPHPETSKEEKLVKATDSKKLILSEQLKMECAKKRSQLVIDNNSTNCKEKSTRKRKRTEEPEMKENIVNGKRICIDDKKAADVRSFLFLNLFLPEEW